MTGNLDKYFKERLEDYFESPSPDTWDGIAARLGHDRKRKAIAIFWRIAAGVTLLISLSIIMQDTKKPVPAELTETVTEQKDIQAGQIAENDLPNLIATVTPERENPAPENTSVQNRQIEKESLPKDSNTSYPAETIAENRTDDYSSNSVSNDIIVSENNTREENYPEMIVPLGSTIPIAERPGIESPAVTDKQSNNQPLQAYAIDQLLAMNEPLTEEKSKKNSWAVGGQFAPQYSYRNIVSDEYSDYVISQINSKESSVITYSGGVNVTLTPNKRLSVQSGIYYSRYGQEQSDMLQFSMDKNVIIDQLPFDALENYFGTNPQQLVYLNNSSGPVTLGSKASASLNQSPSNSYYRNDASPVNAIATEKPINSISYYFEYLEVPVNLRYKVVDRKIDVSVFGGLSTNFLVGTGFNLNYSDASSENITRSTSDLAQINYAGSVGMGIEYPLIKNIILTIEPKFKYYLNPIDKDPLSDIHPYAVGLFTGVNYRF